MDLAIFLVAFSIVPSSAPVIFATCLNSDKASVLKPVRFAILATWSPIELNSLTVRNTLLEQKVSQQRRVIGEVSRALGELEADDADKAELLDQCSKCGAKDALRVFPARHVYRHSRAECTKCGHSEEL